MTLTLGFWAVAAQAQEFRYRYVALDQVVLPEGSIFFEPKAINNSGQVYGDSYKCTTPTCDEILPYLAVYAHGAVTVLQPDQSGVVYAVNEKGTAGGSVFIDTTNFIEQAALFRGHSVELVPPQPGEVNSHVIALNDRGTALVESQASEQVTYVLYRNGQTTPLDFGPAVRNPGVTGINNQGIISGTEGPRIVDANGFRFDPRTGEATLLYPLPTEPNAWGLGINNRGDVLGYSFITSGRERIGVWNRTGTFKTYFVEGTPEFPTVSNALRFNDNNLIVITRVSAPPPTCEHAVSYLVPKPGMRLNLADLVENLPSPETPFWLVLDINNRGDMIGYNSFCGGTFLLERMAGPHSFATPDETIQSSAEGRRHEIPPAVAARLLRQQLPLKSGSALR